MKFRKMWMVLAACVLTVGLLTGCEGETEPSPAVSEPAVTESQPQEEVKTPVPEPEADGEELPAEEIPLEEMPEVRALTEKELAEWSEWLGERGICQLFHVPFDNPEEIDLGMMCYDGLGEGHDTITEKERAALTEVAGEIYLDIDKVTVAELTAHYLEVTGLEIGRREIERRLTGWYYLEEYDAYYHFHGDTAWLSVSCTEGWLRYEDGTIVLTCSVFGTLEPVYTVGLTENKDGYVLSYIRVSEN